MDLSHRLLTRAFLVRVRNQARQPRDQKDGVAELVGKHEVCASRGDGAIRVDGQMAAHLFFSRIQHAFDHANHPYVLTFELEFQGHLKEEGGARVASMEPVAKSWGRLALA